MPVPPGRRASAARRRGDRAGRGPDRGRRPWPRPAPWPATRRRRGRGWRRRPEPGAPGCPDRRRRRTPRPARPRRASPARRGRRPAGRAWRGWPRGPAGRSWASSIRARTSSSISDDSSSPWSAASRPMPASGPPTARGPSESLIPHSVTIARAMRGGPLDVVVGAGGDVAEHAAPRRVRPPSSMASSSRSWPSCRRTRSSAGSDSVQPSARPRATIDTLWIGSVSGSTWPTRAWPASWWAITDFSRSDITRVRRSGPAITRSMASSHSFIGSPSVPAGPRAAPPRSGGWPGRRR